MKVVNMKEKGKYIGRPSVLGNPFVIGRDGSRDEVIDKFEVFARNNAKVLAEIKKLQEHDVLRCYCAPLACHGDVIVKLWKEMQ